MKLMPSSTTRRSVAMAWSRLGGSRQIPGPVIRMAPKPRRLTVRSPPTSMVPAAAAVQDVGGSAMGWLLVVRSAGVGAAMTRVLPDAAGHGSRRGRGFIRPSRGRMAGGHRPVRYGGRVSSETVAGGLLAGLNPVQLEAVTHPGGPLLIIAGAGSG